MKQSPFGSAQGKLSTSLCSTRDEIGGGGLPSLIPERAVMEVLEDGLRNAAS
jgi:hypothetical protein